MKFDKRITDISKIMNCFTVEDAKRYLHTYGYFADHIEDFAKLNEIDMNELTSIQQDFKYPYAWRYDNTFKFFLPCAFVADEEEKKEKENKYRPFTLQEFEDFVNNLPSNYIIFRPKGNNDTYFFMYSGYVSCDDGIVSVILGNRLFSFERLLEYFELKVNDKWQPFGVEE